MIRADLFRAVEFAHAAAHNATLAASYDKINPERAAYFARLSEEALYAALDALSQAERTPGFLAVANEITNTERKAA